MSLISSLTSGIESENEEEKGKYICKRVYKINTFKSDGKKSYRVVIQVQWFHLRNLN